MCERVGLIWAFLGYFWAFLLTHECSRALKREEKSNFAQTFSVLLILKQKFDWGKGGWG